MCIVTVEVDQEVLRGFDPTLDSTTAIRKWVQQLVDLRMRQMEFENTKTIGIEETQTISDEAVRKDYTLPNRDMTPDELFHSIEDEIDRIYMKG